MTDAPRSFGWLDALLSTVLSGLVYGLLRQDVFYKTDGPYLVLNLDQGVIEHPYNVLYMPLLDAFASATSFFGWTAFETAGWFSVVGTALAVGLFAIATRRAGYGQTRWALALFALCPPILFFATVVEHHGPFLPFAALSLWVTVEMARRPHWLWAVLFAVATHGAWLMHGTGAFLPAPLLTWYLARRWKEGALRADFIVGSVAGALHIASILLLREIELPHFDAAMQEVRDKGIGAPRGIEYVPEVWLWEWVIPFLPLSVVWLWGCFAGRSGPAFVALTVGLVPYVFVCERLIVGEWESGAYLLPLSFLATWFCADRLSGRWLIRTLGATVVVAALAVIAHHGVSGYGTWELGFAELARKEQKPLHVLMGGTDELSFALARTPELERFLPHEAVRVVAQQGQDGAAMVQVFEGYADAKAAEGRAVYFTSGAAEQLDLLIAEGGDVAGVARELRRWIEETYGYADVPHRAGPRPFNAVKIR